MEVKYISDPSFFKLTLDKANSKLNIESTIDLVEDNIYAINNKTKGFKIQGSKKFIPISEHKYEIRFSSGSAPYLNRCDSGDVLELVAAFDKGDLVQAVSFDLLDRKNTGKSLEELKEELQEEITAVSNEVSLIQAGQLSIPTWTAIAFPSGSNVNYLGKDWVANAATLASDVPGVSGKWVERLSGYSNAVSVPIVRGTHNSATAIITLSASSAWKVTRLRALENVSSIQANDVRTYNSAQKTIFYYEKINNDTYNLVASEYVIGNFNIPKSSFPSNATHYIITGIFDISPNMAVTEMVSVQKLTERNAKDLLDYKKDVLKEESDTALIMSIVDTSKTKSFAAIEEDTGREIPSQFSTANATDFCRIQHGVEYATDGYILNAYQYDWEKKYIGKVTVVANTTFTITDTNCFYVRLVLSGQSHRVYVKKYGVSSPSGGFHLPIYTGRKERIDVNRYKYLVHGFGDSIISKGGWFDRFSSLSGYSGRNFTYGGCQSSMIRDKFEALANKDNAINLIWVGHNNVSETQNIINDIRYMVRLLSHQRFIILTPPPGTYATLSQTQEFINNVKKLEDSLQAIFGGHVLNIRKAVTLGGYDMGGNRLLAPFVQPEVGANVTAEMSNVPFLQFSNPSDVAGWIPSHNRILIGFSNSYDTYEIVSSVITPVENGGDGLKGTVTLKLLSGTRIATGATVDNIHATNTPSGTSTPVPFIKYLEVIKECDKYLMDLGTTPTTFREDAVHPGSYGGACIGELVAWKLRDLQL